MQRIMVATDGSQGADRAVDTAARLAAAFQATLKIVNVVEAPLSEREAVEARSLGLSAGEAIDAAADQVLSDAAARAKRLGAPKIEILSCIGDPAEILIEVAKREQTDAIVVGRRGRGRLTGLLLGSVSAKLASLAPCSVMIVPR